MLTHISRERAAAATHVPAAGCDLTHLSNAELIAGTRRLVGASNQVFAMLLAHLAEVEARGLHRERACSSLYTYCIYELRFSEDAAYRRVSASRLVKRFPVLYDAVASGELHLTGLLMLGPHLTTENHIEVLARAKHRTKVELSKLLRSLDPLPDLPARIEPLGPAPARPAKMNPSWGDYIAAWAPVRQLGPGDAPRDWMNDELLEFPSPECQPPGTNVSQPEPVPPEPLGPAPARPGAAPLTVPLRYKVQFSAQEEYVQLVERAKALLSNAHSKSSLEEIHVRAMRLLVADLEKRRFGKTEAPQRRSGQGGVSAGESSQPIQSGSERPRSRYIPAAIRGEVFDRDAARCTYVDSTGQRCRETHCLELHHLQAFALAGEHHASNLALRCRAHNALAAEEDFGRSFMDRKRTSDR